MKKEILTEEDKFDVALDADTDFRTEYYDSQRSLLTLCDAIKSILGEEQSNFETFYKVANVLRNDRWLDAELNATDKARIWGYFRIIETKIEYPEDLHFVGEPAFYAEKQTYLTDSGVKWLKNYIHERKII